MQTRREDSAAPVVIAHRGDSSAAPENTIPAVELAWAGGAPWIEIDVQPTKDNVPVIIHDHTLERTSNGTGRVRDLTGAEISELDAGTWFGVERSGTHEYDGAGIPTLRDVIDTLAPGRHILLEIKGEHSLDEVREILETVRASEWDDQILLQSFEVSVLRHIRTLDADRIVGLLDEKLDDDPVAVCKELGAVLYNPRYTAILGRADVVGALHDAGIGTFPWTADNPADWQNLTEIGVDGIITNRPVALSAWQAEQAQSAGKA